MARRVVSKTELAGIAGVSKPSISVASQRNFPRAAVGNGVDVDHADVQKYLTGKPGALTRLAEFFALGPSPSRLTHTPKPPPPPTNSPAQRAAERRYATPSQNVDVEELLDLTLREICAQYGSVPAAGQILDLVRKGVDIREREIKIAERTGRLISRELVRTAVFSHLEALHRRLFTDASLTIARRVHQIGRAGGSTEDAERLVRDLLRQEIRPAKDTVTLALRTFGAGDEEPEDEPAQPASERDEHAP